MTGYRQIKFERSVLGNGSYLGSIHFDDYGNYYNSDDSLRGLVLDFTKNGRLIGIEFLCEDVMPEWLSKLINKDDCVWCWSEAAGTYMTSCEYNSVTSSSIPETDVSIWKFCPNCGRKIHYE